MLVDDKTSRRISLAEIGGFAIHNLETAKQKHDRLALEMIIILYRNTLLQVVIREQMLVVCRRNRHLQVRSGRHAN